MAQYDTFVILGFVAVLACVVHVEAFYVRSWRDDELQQEPNPYQTRYPEDRYLESPPAKREQEEAYMVGYPDDGFMYNLEEESAQQPMSADKRYLCRKMFVYNPLKNSCMPTLMALRKGRRSRSSRSGKRFMTYF